MVDGFRFRQQKAKPDNSILKPEERKRKTVSRQGFLKKPVIMVFIHSSIFDAAALAILSPQLRQPEKFCVPVAFSSILSKTALASASAGNRIKVAPTHTK